MRLCLLAAVFAAPWTAAAANAQDTNTIRVLERHTLSPAQIRRHDPGTPKATHSLALTLVYLAGGAWPRETVLETARIALTTLAQCGLLLRRAELVKVDAPARYHDFDTPFSRALARTLRLPAPTVYFVSDTRQQPAFDAEAIGRANSASRPELADSVWLTRATRDAGLALAHELVHVLADSGAHVERPANLMRAETAPENTALTPAQCAAIRDVGASNRLLQAQ